MAGGRERVSPKQETCMKTWQWAAWESPGASVTKIGVGLKSTLRDTTLCPHLHTLFIVALNLSQLCVSAPLPLTAGFVLNEPTLSLQSSHLRGEFRVSLGWLGEGLLLSNGSPGYVASGDPGIDLSKMCLIHELFFDPVSTLIVCPWALISFLPINI